MRYAIFSDVHANLTALERIVADARDRGVGRYLCLGDVVGYGPQPAEVLAMVRGIGATVLAGNHDDAVCGRGSAEDFIDLAGEAVLRHRAALDDESLSFLRKLPYRAKFAGAVAVHGDFVAPKRFDYVDDEAAAAANFAAQDSPLAFVGHTHVPCIFLTGQSGRVYRLTPQDFVLEPGKRYIVNPGSVGYPREANGSCLSSYVIYDTVTGTVGFRFLPFAVSSVMQRGSGHRSGRRWLQPLVAVGAMALSAAVVICLRTASTTERLPLPQPPVTMVVTQTVKTAMRGFPKPFAEKSLSLRPGDVFVRANVRLAKGSDPVQLRILFCDASGCELSVEVTLVKSSSRQRFQIPDGTRLIRFSLSKLTDADRPEVVSFDPVAECRSAKSGRIRK